MEYPRSAEFVRVVDVWLHVDFLWLISPAATGIITLFDVFVEPHGRAALLFAGRTLPTSSPSPPTSTLLVGVVAVGVLVLNAPSGNRTAGTPSSDVFDVR